MLNIKKIKPMFTAVLTTAYKYTADDTKNEVIVTDVNKLKGTIREYQKVVAIGDMVRGIKVGDLVWINPSRYIVRKYDPNSIRDDAGKNEILGYKIPQVEMEGITYLLLQENDIQYVIEEYEDKSPQSEIIHTEPKLIL